MIPVTKVKSEIEEITRTVHHFSSGVYIKQMHLPANHYAETHAHAYDHFGLLGSGNVIVEIGGKEEAHIGPCVIEIKAGVKHKIRAITDIVWFCIHAVDIANKSAIDDVLIKGD